MSDVISAQPPAVAGEPADQEAAFQQLLAEARRLNDLMQADRADIERLRGEAWALRAETRAVLAGLGAQL